MVHFDAIDRDENSDITVDITPENGEEIGGQQLTQTSRSKLEVVVSVLPFKMRVVRVDQGAPVLRKMGAMILRGTLRRF